MEINEYVDKIKGIIKDTSIELLSFLDEEEKFILELLLKDTVIKITTDFNYSIFQ